MWVYIHVFSVSFTPHISVSRLPTALGPSNSKSKSYSYSYLQLYLYSYVGDLFTTVIICKKCHYNLEKISGLCNKLSFTHSPKQYEIPSSVYILKCLEGSLFFNILYIFVLSYFCEEGKEVEKYEMLIFWLRFFLHLYLYLCNWVMELTMFCQEWRGAFVCGWVRNCFVGSSFFSLFFFLPGVFTKMICKQIGYENSIELWDFLC